MTRRRMDYQLPLPLGRETVLEETRHTFPHRNIMESAVGAPLRTQNAMYSSVTNLRATDPSSHSPAECKQSKIPTKEVLATLQVFAQLLLPFQRVDNTITKCPPRSGGMSEGSSAQRPSALSPHQTAVVTPPVGPKQIKLIGNMRLMPSEGA